MHAALAAIGACYVSDVTDVALTRADIIPTASPSSRQRGSSPAKAVKDRRLESVDETDLRDDGGNI